MSDENQSPDDTQGNGPTDDDPEGTHRGGAQDRLRPGDPVDIYELGLIYDVDVDDELGKVQIRMTLTSPLPGRRDAARPRSRPKVRGVEGVGDVSSTSSGTRPGRSNASRRPPSSRWGSRSRMASTGRQRKPRHLGPDYASQWQDAGMARAYVRRPPYPEETFDILQSLLAPGCPSAVLDVGAGTGDLARPLSLEIDRVDAVEPSAAMIDVGRHRTSHGHAANLRWIQAPIEAAELDPPYGLAVAGESIHWTNWNAAFPRIREALAPEAVFAIVGRQVVGFRGPTSCEG